MVTKVIAGYWRITFNVTEKGHQRLHIETKNGTNFSLFDDEIQELKDFINNIEVV